MATQSTCLPRYLMRKVSDDLPRLPPPRPAPVLLHAVMRLLSGNVWAWGLLAVYEVVGEGCWSWWTGNWWKLNRKDGNG